MSDEIRSLDDAVANGWSLMLFPHPSFRNKGRYSAIARKGDVFIECDADSIRSLKYELRKAINQSRTKRLVGTR